MADQRDHLGTLPPYPAPLPRSARTPPGTIAPCRGISGRRSARLDFAVVSSVDSGRSSSRRHFLRVLPRSARTHSAADPDSLRACTAGSGRGRQSTYKCVHNVECIHRYIYIYIHTCACRVCTQSDIKYEYYSFCSRHIHTSLRKEPHDIRKHNNIITNSFRIAAL